MVVEFFKSILFELRGSSLRTVKHEQLQQQHQQKQHALEAWSDESGELDGVSICCCCCCCWCCLLLPLLFWLLRLFELFSLLFDEFSRFEYVLICFKKKNSWLIEIENLKIEFIWNSSQIECKYLGEARKDFEMRFETGAKLYSCKK